MNARRIFWGRSLAQAVSKAARYYKLAPEALAWRRHEKRHGFVKHPRAVLVEVDPEAPARAPGAPPAELTPRGEGAGRSESAPRSEGVPRREVVRRSEGENAPRRESAASAGASRASAPRPVRVEEPYDAPDEESEQAALEAISRLLRFAGIDATGTIARRGDRLEVALTPAAGSSSAAIDVALVDDLEHLLPKAISTLSGRRVRVGVDFAGRREARAEELRVLAAAAAERVRATGTAETLGPLPSPERRIVHLLFENDPEIATESVGDGYRKKIRILPRRGA